MAGLFSRLKVWALGENLASSDLNAEFNNIINNIDPTKMSGYSTNVAQMKIQTNPGGEGTESLAQTTSDEVERLRYAISRIVGGSFWYDTPALSITDINSLISQGNLTPPSNRIVSGKVRASSNQSAFLVAGGSTAKVTLKGASTNFIYRVAGTQYTVSSDVDLTFSSFAPSSNNTATVNDSTLAGGAATAIQGENATVITITSVGSNITALQGNLAAFKIVDGINTEYFIGYVNSATQITKCFRGFFFDSTYSPVVRTVVNNSDTITLMKLFWVFANSSGTLDSTSNNPKVSFATPSSPASGDYWFDLTANLWKKYNGSAFVASSATLIGLAVCDTSHCIASRAFEFYAPYDKKNTVEVEIQDNNTLRTVSAGSVVNVAGNLVNFNKAIAYWVKPDNFDTGVSDGASKTFYAYLKDTGDVVLSDVIPYDRTADLQGKYHPYNPWRSVAIATNDASSHFLYNTSEARNTDHLDLGILQPSPNPSLINIGLRYASNTLTICGQDQKDLSYVNPGYVTVPSAVTAGLMVRIPVRANKVLVDGSSGDIAGLFGTTTSKAWANNKPYYLYAVNLDDTEANLAFAFSGIPNIRNTSLLLSANYFGYKANAAVTSDPGNLFFLLSSSPSSYTSAPAVLMGGFFMTKNSSDKWTISLGSDIPNISPLPLESQIFTMPISQNGADSGNYFTCVGGGTAPSFSAVTYFYKMKISGEVYVSANFAGTATNGSGGQQVELSMPIWTANTSFTGSQTILAGIYQASAHSPTTGSLVLQATVGSNIFPLYEPSHTTIVNTDFSSGANNLRASFVYDI